MKIVLTGATGFIGHELGIALARDGHTLTVLARNIDRARLDIPFPAEIAHWDPAGSEAQAILANLLAGADAVINLAGEPIQTKGWSSKRIQDLTESRVATTSAIVAATRALGGRAPKVHINASAIGFYGSASDLDAPALNESSPSGQGILSDICRAWEDALALGTDEATVRRVALRIGVVLGRHGGMMREVLPIFRRGGGGRLGSGRQWLSWIHVADVVRMMQWALATSSVRGVLNATAPKPARNVDFTAALAKTLRRLAILPAPSLAIRIGLGKRSELLLGSTRVAPERAIAGGFQFRFASLDSALTDICGDDVERGIDELNVRQWVTAPLDKVVPFFQDEKNLERLTPAMLNFKVLSKSTPQIQEGTLIDYRLRIRGVPARWRTLIKDWDPPRKFVDTQLKGPYRLWHHTHLFETLGNGTLLTDRVQFKLPMGILGDLAAGWLVRGDVSKIFAHRKTVARELFGGNK